MKNYRKSGNEILAYAIMSPLALLTLFLMANAAYRFAPKFIFGFYEVAAEFARDIVSVINFLVN
ncbi:MAG: hypothetical protein A3J63_04755 [Candidatus Moranbacteria bacterium RIFCSPHIGHO2_02_FULL_40_12b]|nr:MAG: hypothetical protein A3J63_04755 [Candidatus Moranbacteria bacterium RIFCSPHIGHO2_02_FULL_40_12b]OGI23294.1 MAG: hypothetical protein A3E91_00670 [Candidatus Moranbacteria bacterium RIFCSPHIGHO2_12_FULL_40_10]